MTKYVAKKKDATVIPTVQVIKEFQGDNYIMKCVAGNLGTTVISTVYVIKVPLTPHFHIKDITPSPPPPKKFQ